MTNSSALGVDPSSPRSTTAQVPGRWRTDESVVTLRLDLTDLPIPSVHNLHVEGLQKSWWQRLIGG